MTLTMTEHPDTFKIIRKDYMEKIGVWFNKNYDRQTKAYPRASFQQHFDRCTALQLRAYCKLIDRELPDLLIVPTDPTNYAGASFAGMFLGIETDGHTHS